jgi:hypothetical protein
MIAEWWVGVVLSFLTGLLVAIAEMFPRYRDEPLLALANRYGIAYLVFNGLLGTVAFSLWLGQVDDPTYAGASAWSSLADPVAAGLAAAAILRARVFSLKVGAEEYPVGPGILTNALLAYLEKQIDRQRAGERIKLVRQVMEGVSFDEAKLHVGNMISGGMQNLSAEERRELGRRIGEIEADAFPAQEKAYELGFLVLDFLGEKLFKELFKR